MGWAVWYLMATVAYSLAAGLAFVVVALLALGVLFVAVGAGVFGTAACAALWTQVSGKVRSRGATLPSAPVNERH
jgi:hypothetical protein